MIANVAIDNDILLIILRVDLIFTLIHTDANFRSER